MKMRFSKTCSIDGPLIIKGGLLPVDGEYHKAIYWISVVAN